MTNQFGIQLAGAREPLWIAAEFETLTELRAWLIAEPLREVVLVGGLGRSCLVNHQHVVAVCGPNSPYVCELFQGRRSE